MSCKGVCRLFVLVALALVLVAPSDALAQRAEFDTELDRQMQPELDPEGGVTLTPRVVVTMMKDCCDWNGIGGNQHSATDVTITSQTSSTSKVVKFGRPNRAIDRVSSQMERAGSGAAARPRAC